MKHVLLTVVFLGIACVAMAHELLSPNGNLKLNVVLDSEGGRSIAYITRRAGCRTFCLGNTYGRSGFVKWLPDS